MRTTSLILGIIGSALAILLGGLGMYNSFYTYSYDDYYYEEYNDYDSVFAPAADEALPDEDESDISYEVDTYTLVTSSMSVLGGLLGVLGCIIVNRKNSTAGILFIIASVISITTVAPTVLFIIAAVQALKTERPAVPLMYMPVPPGAYPGYYPVAYPPQYAPPAYPPQAPPPAGAYPPPPVYPAYNAYPPQTQPQYAPPAYPPQAPAYPPPWPYGSAWTAPPQGSPPPQPPTDKPDKEV